MRFRYRLLVLVLVSSIFMFSCQALSAPPIPSPTTESAAPIVTPIIEDVIIETQEALDPQATEIPVVINEVLPENVLVDIYEQSNPGVVAILVLTDSGNGPENRS